MSNEEGVKVSVLINLHRYDVWEDELLGELFEKERFKLHPRERLILELKCEGKSDEYIIKLMKRCSMQGTFSEQTFSNMKASLKKKLRIGFNDEVQGWIKYYDRRETDNE